MKLKYQMRGLGVGIIVTALLMGVATGKGIPLSDAEIKAKALELGMVESDSIRLTDLTNGSPAPEGSASPEEGGENGSGEAGASKDAVGTDGSDELRDSSEAADGSEDTQGTGGSGDGSGEGTSGGASGSEGETGGRNTAESGAASSQDASAGAGSGDAASVTGGQDGEVPSSGENGADRNHPDNDAVTVVIEFGVTSSHVSEILEEAGLVEDATAFDSYLCNNGYSRSITAGTYEIAPGTSEEEIVKIITKTR